MAVANYADANGHFPPAYQLGPDRRLWHSWRVLILPFIEQDSLLKQYRFDEPWDGEHNKKLIDKMPKIYALVRGKAEAGTTFYQAFGGSNGALVFAAAGHRVALYDSFEGARATALAGRSALYQPGLPQRLRR